MTDGYALLRAIEANPDEDTPRLAYADWLEEHAASDADRARAEFIRVQCELARLPKDDPRVPLLNIRERNSVAPHCGAWVQQFGVKLVGLRFERGFLTPLHTHAADFLTHASRFASVAPLSDLCLASMSDPKVIEDVAGSRFLRCVRYFDLSGRGLTDKLLARLANSPHWENLRRLDLSHNDANRTTCETLRAGLFPSLRALLLSRNSIGDTGLRILRDATWFANLETLDLSTTAITDAAVAELVADPSVRRLKSLNLSDRTGRNWKDPTARAILDSPHLLQLQRLVFPVTGLTADTQAALRARFGTAWNLSEFTPD